MNPLMAFKDFIKKEGLKPLDRLDKDDKKTIGYISKVTEIKTKNGDLMAFVQITDYNVTLEMTIFSNAYLVNKDKLILNQPMIFNIRSNMYDGLKFIIERIEHVKNNQT